MSAGEEAVGAPEVAAKEGAEAAAEAEGSAAADSAVADSMADDSVAGPLGTTARMSASTALPAGAPNPTSATPPAPAPAYGICTVDDVTPRTEATAAANARC